VYAIGIKAKSLIPYIRDFFQEFVKKIQNEITNRIIGRTFNIAKLAAAYHLWKPIMRWNIVMLTQA